MTETTETTHIPGDDEVQVASGGKAFHFARGKIVRGAPDGNNIYPEEKAKVVGIPKRIGIHNGVGKDDGKAYSQLEVDLEGRDGMVYLKASLTDPKGPGLKVSVSTVNFGWICTQLEAGKVYCISTALGEPMPEGGRPTYVNLASVKGSTATPMYRPRTDKNAPKKTLLEQWAELDPLIRAHPLFADRPSSRDDDAQGNAQTHLSAFCKECQEKNWPTPEQTPTEWITMVEKGLPLPGSHATLRDISDDDWGRVREMLMKQTKRPQPLDEVAKRLGLDAPKEEAASAFA